VVVLVGGANFIIERSSITKSKKTVARLAVLGFALAMTFHWIRNSAAN
jgi:ABC-type iron transport system FetAB permease component